LTQFQQQKSKTAPFRAAAAAVDSLSKAKRLKGGFKGRPSFREARNQPASDSEPGDWPALVSNLESEGEESAGLNLDDDGDLADLLGN
jgi:hypothetical protein